MANIFASIPSGVITTDTEGRVDYLNPAAGYLLGVDEEQARGKRYQQIVPICDE